MADLNYYCLGLMFNDDLSKIVLIKKNRPEQQAGLWNGVGGKINGGELDFDAMTREFEEETGAHYENWRRSIVIHKFEDKERTIQCVIEVYIGVSSDVVNSVLTLTDEEVAVFDIDSIGQVDLVPGLKVLLEIALHDLKYERTTGNLVFF